MGVGKRALAAMVAAAALAATQLAATPGAPAATAPDPAAAATKLLRSDASGPLTLRTDKGGALTFAGVPAGVTVRTPGVSRSTGVRAAAQAVVDRYGAALGATNPGTTLGIDRSHDAVSGDVVRFHQEVGGVPVLGGEVVVSLRADRSLASILSHLSGTTKVKGAAVNEATASRTAQKFFQRSAGKGAAARVESQGRWVVDPDVIGASRALGVKTAWKFELRRGPAEWRMLLVDDQTGQVLMNNDLIHEAKNRIVCDSAEVARPNIADPYPCVTSTPPVRTESSGPAALAEANTAFDLGGAVYDNYLAFGGVDLTNLIGRDIGGGVKALAQTVRFCYTGTCPSYANAFWNGIQMYYGTGYAVADDVVGHEMTHGVTERYSGLFYWGQSGAMNESLSDIMGEIIDHRHVGAGDSPTNWAMGEDLPGFPNGIRNAADPTLFGDPDRTGSPLYVREACCSYPDADGVHTNSGVGNKTFYLASQGGTFNGQTITGIDTGDPDLTKSAKLWLLTDQSLSSGSDYADEAAVLEQSCQTLMGSGVMTAADCTAVHQATLATELRTTPVNNPQPADATMTCPAGTTVRVLLDSESGAPTTKFSGPGSWSRNGIPGWGENAHSNPASWSNSEPSTSGAASLVATSGVALPAGQASYLFFQHWRLLDYDSGSFYDAGTVEVDDLGDASGPLDTAGLPWVNGPTNTIRSGVGNPAGGRLGFGGDSRGYLASRVDVSSYAGKTVKPQFTMNTDSSVTYIGWYVDDIALYTCDPTVAPPPPPPPPAAQPSAPTAAKAVGGLGKAVVSWKAPTTNPSSVTGYRVTTSGKTVTVPATALKTTVKGLKQGKTYAFSVVALGSGGFVSPATSATVKGTKVKLKVEGAAGSTGLSGKLTAGGKGLKGEKLKIQTKKKGHWLTLKTVKTGKGGKYSALLSGTKSRPYRVVFAGGQGLMGSQSPQRHL